MVLIQNTLLTVNHGYIWYATGGGKTRVAVEAFLEWMQYKFDENKFMIWIAQSEELCEQCISCIEELNGGVIIAGINKYYY